MATHSVPELIEPSGIRFVVGTAGEPSGVLLDMATWQRIVEVLEDVEDFSIAKEALAKIDAAGGDLEKAGFLPWQNLRVAAETDVAKE